MRRQEPEHKRSLISSMRVYESMSVPCPKWHVSLVNLCPSEFISEHCARHGGDWWIIQWDNGCPDHCTFIRPLRDPSHLFFFLIILSGNFKGPCKMGEAEKFKRNYLNWKVLMQMQHEQLCRAQSLRCLLWPRVFAQDRTMPCHLWSGAAYALFFLAMTSLWKMQCNKVLVTAKACVFTFICS